MNLQVAIFIFVFTIFKMQYFYLTYLSKHGLILIIVFPNLKLQQHL